MDEMGVGSIFLMHIKGMVSILVHLGRDRAAVDPQDSHNIDAVVGFFYGLKRDTFRH